MSTLEDRAKAFALQRHKLFFQKLENLNVGANFIDSMAKFAFLESHKQAEMLQELSKAIVASSTFFEGNSDGPDTTRCYFCTDSGIVNSDPIDHEKECLVLIAWAAIEQTD